MNLTEVSSLLEHESSNAQLVLIEWLVSLTFVLLLLLLPIGFLRRRHNSVVLKLFAWVTYSAVTLLIAYIFGLMRHLEVKHALVAVWATFLLVVYGKTATVLGLRDQKSGAAYLANLIVYITYISILFAQISYTLYVPLILVLLFSDFFFKSRSDFISKSMEFVLEDIALKSDEYMPLSQRLISRIGDSGDAVPAASDLSLQDCSYMVDPKRVKLKGKKVADRGIMIRDLLQDRDPSKQRLKSSCLPFSLFWLLLHSFAGVPCYESSHPNRAWDLMHNGLGSITKDPFEVIEVELAFLYDYFYNRKHFSFYKNKLWVEIARRLLFIGAITWAVIVTFKNHHPQDQYHELDTDVLVTGIVILIITITEFVQFISCLTSRWSKVRLLCICYSRGSWRKHNVLDSCIRNATEILCPVRGELYKPWQRKLGQYSLIESCSFMQDSLSKKLLLFLSSVTGVRIACSGRKRSEAIPLSDEIKQAVIQTLQDAYRPGRTPSIPRLLISFPRDFSVYNDTHDLAGFVLVLHIVTSMCEIHHDPSTELTPENNWRTDFKIATALSKYCAYLVAFAPDLLPGNQAATEATCTMAIEQAHSSIHPHQDPGKQLKEIANENRGSAYPPEEDFFLRGVTLGIALQTKVTVLERRWSILAKFWAGMILYLAPNGSNEWAHAERLSDGGEFITHLWALLFHSGIVNRDRFNFNPE